MADGISLRMRLRRVNLDRQQVIAPDNAIYQAHVRAAEAAVEAAKAEAPVRTGALRDSIEYRIYATPSGNLVADIGPGKTADNGTTPPVEYVAYVHDGTSTPIEPVTSPVLVISDGGPKYHKKVAGQAANPFLARALKKIRAQDWAP